MFDWNFGGISITKRKRCEFIAASISVDAISTAGLNVGPVRPSAIRRDRSERSSSTMPTERLVASVDAPVAAA
jgi:hypothetical protein